MSRRLPLAAPLAVAVLLLPIASRAGADTGEAAFARQDYATAAELWTEEAARGSIAAKFGLGVICDLGLGRPRDPTGALRWYLEAARGGMAEAQFNVGVMLDAGAGVPRDTALGAIWYARAAANGHPRGQYNLGLLYERGEGVPRNIDLARYWFGQAGATLPAAEEHLAALGGARPGGPPTAPSLSSAALIGGRAELVWTSAPGPAGSDYLVELARLPGPGESSGAIAFSARTSGSAVAPAVAAGADAYAWRVSQIDGRAARYRASGWQVIGAEDGAAAASGLPAGRVRIRFGPDDGPARLLARELTAEFRAAGLWVESLPAATRPRESRVRFGYLDDAGFAARVASSLPVSAARDARFARDLDLAPGEVEVWLVGGPAEPDR